MNANSRETLSSAVARAKGRARLRATTVALGAAGLITAGAVAYTLPSPAHTASATTAVTAPGGSGTQTVHTTSGGSGVAAAPASTRSSAGQAATPARSSAGQAATPASSSGTAHAASGGS